MKRLLIKTHSASIPVILKWGQLLRGSFPILGLIALLLMQTSCESRRAVSGILVLGVEGLKPEDIACTEGETEYRGFNFLCHEFIRLQGTVAGSTSSAANMASLLTGLPPEKHGLRINDAFLSSNQVLLSEKLSSRDWKAGLLTAAPPIARRTNLNQGFETFDESLPLAPRVPFRSLEQSSLTAVNWLTEPDTKKFFLVMTASELLNTEFASVSDKGESRPRSIDGQIEELDESLFHFFEDLKRRKLWDRMWIVVVGLSGRTESDDDSPTALQIGPSQLQVPVFIKGRDKAGTEVKLLKGVWSHAQIGQFLEELSNELERKSASDGSWAEATQALMDHSVPFVKAEACATGTSSENDNLKCRYAFFDQTAWLSWESPLRLDLGGRRELHRKIREEIKEEPPERDSRPLQVRRKDIQPWKSCIENFQDSSAGSNLHSCPSKSAQILRNLYLLRKTVDARPESLRDERLRFLHDWAQLSAANDIFKKYEKTRLFSMSSKPSEELQTLEKILDTPELSDIRREALRSTAKPKVK